VLPVLYVGEKCSLIYLNHCAEFLLNPVWETIDAKYLAHAAGLEGGSILRLVLHLSQLQGAPVLCSIM